MKGQSRSVGLHWCSSSRYSLVVGFSLEDHNLSGRYEAIVIPYTNDFTVYFAVELQCRAIVGLSEIHKFRLVVEKISTARRETTSARPIERH